MSMTPSDLKNLAQNKNIFSDSSLTSTIFRPPTWFHCDEQTFLVSQLVSVWWNVRDVSTQGFKTQASLINGVIINIFGQNRAMIAAKCLNLNACFEDDDFNKKLVFKL